MEILLVAIVFLTLCFIGPIFSSPVFNKRPMRRSFRHR